MTPPRFDDRPAHRASSVLPRSVRTFKPRRSRITKREQRALDNPQGLVLEAQELINTGAPIRVAEIWGGDMPLTVEIGFGIGDSTVAMAQQEPDTAVLAIDVHTPGVGHLLAELQDAKVTNVRVLEADALAILEHCVGDHQLTEVRSFFPDPWPKARHHKRRLVQPSIAALIHRTLRPGGTWWIATDWDEYAESIREVMAALPEWSGGEVSRPDHRPTTVFEKRAVKEGRSVTDFVYSTLPMHGSHE